MIFLILIGIELDAQEFIRYTTDCCNLISNNITAVVIDSKGGKWFGTDNGLLHFDGIKWTNYQSSILKASIPSNKINDLAIEISSKFGERIWVATDNGATVVSSIFNELTYATPFQENNSNLLSNNVKTVYVGNNHTLWFGTNKGLSRFDGSEWSNFIELSDLSKNEVLSIAGSKDGIIYVGTNGGGISRYLDNNGVDGITSASIIDTKWSGILSNNIYAIEVNEDSSKWIGTDKGLNLHKSAETKEGWYVYLSDAGLVNNHVQAIAKDNTGLVWIGTKKGVSSFDGKESWKSYTVKDGLSGNDIRDISVDKDGSIWFATDKGVSHYIKK
jgi:ligand-binding sensor domain-containing protein